MTLTGSSNITCILKDITHFILAHMSSIKIMCSSKTIYIHENNMYCKFGTFREGFIFLKLQAWEVS